MTADDLEMATPRVTPAEIERLNTRIAGLSLYGLMAAAYVLAHPWIPDGPLIGYPVSTQAVGVLWVVVFGVSSWFASKWAINRPWRLAMTAKEESVWVWCAECGPRARFKFQNPNKVRCSQCGQIVGETTEEVLSKTVALKTRYRIAVDVETGNVVAGVEWDTNRVEVEDRDDS